MRETTLKRERDMLMRKFKDSISHYTVKIDDADTNVIITNTDNLNEKTIYSMPSSHLDCGSLVYWLGKYWIITEKDANDTICDKCKMSQCNHLLKWVDTGGIIHEQWCVVEDGTKYLTGEFEDRHFVVTRGDSRICVIISRNKATASMKRGDRFIIDDDDSIIKIAYTLTKPLKVGMVYDGKGVYKYVMQESVITDDDNQELGIADYYKYFDNHGNPKANAAGNKTNTSVNDDKSNNVDTSLESTASKKENISEESKKRWF